MLPLELVVSVALEKKSAIGLTPTVFQMMCNLRCKSCISKLTFYMSHGRCTRKLRRRICCMSTPNRHIKMQRVASSELQRNRYTETMSGARRDKLRTHVCEPTIRMTFTSNPRTGKVVLDVGVPSLFACPSWPLVPWRKFYDSDSFNNSQRMSQLRPTSCRLLIVYY